MVKLSSRQRREKEEDLALYLDTLLYGSILVMIGIAGTTFFYFLLVWIS